MTDFEEKVKEYINFLTDRISFLEDHSKQEALSKLSEEKIKEIKKLWEEAYPELKEETSE